MTRRALILTPFLLLVLCPFAAAEGGEKGPPLITNDAVVLGLLFGILAFVFWSSGQGGAWKKFYTYVPSLLLCYFLPSVLSSSGLISGDAEHSRLYFVASRYLLPTSLVLLTLSIDMKAVIALGPKALIMFLTGTVGIVLGGPLAILIVSGIMPDGLGGISWDDAWRGLTTVAGSWIGGGANQAAMKEVFMADMKDADTVFSAMVTVDVIVANVWMAFLLIAAQKNKAIDRWNKADTSAIEALKEKMGTLQAKSSRIPSLTDLMVILAIGFGATAVAHLCADIIAPKLTELGKSHEWIERMSLANGFFWIVVVATTLGLILSFTKLRNFEGAGASRIGSVALYVLVATIGMKMDILAIFKSPELFLVGGIWLLLHAILLILVAWLIRAPVFFLAVGSQANVGGAASAPIVAAAFHPSLAPVGVLLAVVGYALGTYAAWVCGLMLQAAAG